MSAVLTEYLDCMEDSQGLVRVLLHLAPVQPAVVNPHAGDGEVRPHQRHPRVPPHLDTPGCEDSVTFLPEHHRPRALGLSQLGHRAVQLQGGANLYLDDLALSNNPVLPVIIYKQLTVISSPSRQGYRGYKKNSNLSTVFIINSLICKDKSGNDMLCSLGSC